MPPRGTLLPSIHQGIRRLDMSFAIYLVGFLIFIAGVAWALMTAGVDTIYIAIACVILLGIGIMMAVSKTRSKDHNR
jgi:membrane-bound acyltransferase YfiQ involved in biofilm formation